ncbi:glycosyl hydrolase [Peptoniphilus equinus]|uniref:Glycosyl hydrolase n=1 Tax=Peptoniphilus equinus TaxID=3016343 RepID=A0ABY7QS86_9FIRM|nr:glycosyl hydrolase [Peptoniphilus equinus]WBW49657.1 glycosyl hydrolase [Peptoniphilus equinus]
MKYIKIWIMTLILFSAHNVYAGNFHSKALNEYTMEVQNLQDGYTVQLPGGSTITHEGEMNALEADFFDVHLKIYVDTLDKGFSYQDYEVYSVAGIKKGKEHYVSFDGNVATKNGTMHKILFNRPNLSKVAEDKPYYMVLMKNLGGKVLTVMAKSSTPINEALLVPIAESVRFNITAVPKAPDKVPQNYFNTTRTLSDVTYNVYNDDFLKEKPTEWGVFIVDFWRNVKLGTIENALHHTFKYMLVYQDFNYPNSNVQDALHAAKLQNRVVELTFQTQIKDNLNETYRVLNGDYDTYLREMAQMVAKAQTPVLFRIGNEMNGDWCAYSAYNTGLDSDIYKAFYNYLYTIFSEEGALPYTLFVFNPNGRNFPNFKYNYGSEYRPDSTKYDIVGMTLYNTGTYYEDEKWESFETLYGPLYNQMVNSYDKPLMITEFSSSTVGGDKVLWAEDMFKALAKYPKIKVAIWWDGVDKDANGNEARIYNIDRPYELVYLFDKYLPNNR